MSGFGIYVREKDSSIPAHPKLRYWTQLLNQEGTQSAKIEVRRIRDGLSFEPAKIYIDFLGANGSIIKQDCDDWDLDLNSELIHLGIRSVDIPNEIVRFGLMLRSMLEKPEVRFGDAYYHSVLIDILRSVATDANTVVSGKLKYIHEILPDKSGQTYDDCREMIERAFVKCAEHSFYELKYSKEETERIIEGATAYYLDEKFSITNRKLMGFIA